MSAVAADDGCFYCRFRLLASYFFCLSKRSNQEKDTPVPAPFGFPAMLDQQRSLRNSTFAAIAATGLEQCSLWPVVALRFSAPPKGKAGANGECCGTKALRVDSPLGAAEHCSIRRKQASGCLSPIGRVSARAAGCEAHRGSVGAQRKPTAERGVLLWVTFLGQARKVTRR